MSTFRNAGEGWRDCGPSSLTDPEWVRAAYTLCARARRGSSRDCLSESDTGAAGRHPDALVRAGCNLRPDCHGEFHKTRIQQGHSPCPFTFTPKQVERQDPVSWLAGPQRTYVALHAAYEQLAFINLQHAQLRRSQAEQAHQ
jgi:hypothetical protein